MDWFRHYHGLCTDPKLHRVSRAAGVNRAVVIAAWCAILEEASSANERGSVASIDAVSLAFLIDVKPHVAGRVLDAIKAAGMLAVAWALGWHWPELDGDMVAQMEAAGWTHATCEGWDAERLEGAGESARVADARKCAAGQVLETPARRLRQPALDRPTR